ncbi:MAG: SDR family NAD(P)-dependent oxidoreductase [Rickettsiales bacterium]|nr:SDR family NAD(P)-dependent oxidoreductase [Rickettsiales bacterium]
MKNLQNKKIWIIGASTGIGAELAHQLAEEGAILALSARDEIKLEHVKNSLKGSNHQIFPLDVRNFDRVKEISETLIKNNGLDSVIFMAAGYQPHQNAGYSDINIAKNIIEVNFIGALNIVHSVLPHFKNSENQEKQIVLCASVAGFRGLPSGQPYCATKAALINYAESLAIENKNIDIKIINPGFVKTRLTDKNEFKMPFIISAEEAAKRIVKGLKSKCFEIHFPKRFTYIMKFIRIIPTCIYVPLMKVFTKNFNEKN